MEQCGKFIVYSLRTGKLHGEEAGAGIGECRYFLRRNKKEMEGKRERRIEGVAEEATIRKQSRGNQGRSTRKMSDQERNDRGGGTVRDGASRESGRHGEKLEQAERRRRNGLKRK